MSPNDKANGTVRGARGSIGTTDYQTFQIPIPILNNNFPLPSVPCYPTDCIMELHPVNLQSGDQQWNNNIAEDHNSSNITTTTDDKKKNKNRKSEPVQLLCYHKHNDGVWNEKRAMDLSLPILAPILANGSKPLPDGGLPTDIICDKGLINAGFTPSTESLDKVNGGLFSPNNPSKHPSYSNANSTTSLVPKGGKDGDDADGSATESLYAMTLQVFVPFLIAGLGMVGAGLVLDQVQHWEVFEKITAIYIVVPPLLGLKGNLEMTLASRLSTLANLGNMDTTKNKLTFIGGNMVISQCLASLIGLLTSLLAVFIGFLQDSQNYDHRHSLVLIASGVATAAASSCILDSIMVMVILLSRRYGVNPDNVATPIAASLGDITTTGLLAGIGTALYSVIDKITWVGPIVFGMFLILLPLWFYIAHKEPYTYDALKTTCVPVIGAMFLSTGGGFILKIAVKIYVDLAVFQPIINGVGGNLVAIQASRIATSLHKTCAKGSLPSSHSSICISPFAVFFGRRDKHVRCTQILMMMVIPGQLIFIYTTSFISTGKAVLSVSFVCVYLFAAMLQVAVLLYIATIITYLVWRYKIDPDNFSIPLLTALGDLLGIGLLALAFLFLEAVGERVAFINT